MWLRPKSICLPTFVNDACQAQSESRLIHWAYCLQSPAIVQLQKEQATGRRRYSVLWPENWAMDRTHLPHAASSTRASFIFYGKGGSGALSRSYSSLLDGHLFLWRAATSAALGRDGSNPLQFSLNYCRFCFGGLWKRKSEGLMIYYRNGWLIGKPCDTDFSPVDNKREKGARGNCWGFMLLPSVEPICEEAVNSTRSPSPCCDMGQNDTIGKIELNQSFVLSSDNTNYKNDIQ